MGMRRAVSLFSVGVVDLLIEINVFSNLICANWQGLYELLGFSLSNHWDLLPTMRTTLALLFS